MAILPMLFCACSSFNEENSAPIIPVPSDLQAGFAEDTRTYVENNKYLRWHEDDRLTAFYGNTLNRQYKFNGKTGDNSGTFSLVASGELGAGNAFDYIYAVYPYNKTTTITDEGEISLTLPAVQSYAENSFGKGANTMIAVTENLEDTFLAFRNACGYLKLKLYNANGATIKSVEIKGNNNEKIAGAATATIAFDDEPKLTMADSATTFVTIDCGEGITLGTTTENITTFWFVLPPTRFEKGFTITITNINGEVYNKTTSNTVCIGRNLLQPMQAVEVVFKSDKPTNNEIWYTTLSNNVDFPYDNNVFGANIISNTYENGKGVIRFDNDITSIGQYAFFMKNELLSLTIPDSVTSIDSHAFYYCSNLAKVNIGEGVTTIGKGAFFLCSSLKNIVIPDGVTSIENEAFEGCSSLTSISIPDSVATIGDMAFRDCYNLTSVSIGNGVTSIGAIPFLGCKNLSAFYGKFASEDNRYITVNGVLRSFASAGLEEYHIPDGVIEIGKQAFDGANLIKVIIPNSVTKIQQYAFTNCSSLIDITLPNTITQISYGTFQNCSSLTHITIPNGVTSIEGYAFSHCSSLIDITLPNTITQISYGTFQNCSSLTHITIPNGVTSIEGYAFSHCSSLTNVTIPDSVTSIRDYAFSYCNSLQSVTIGGNCSVTSIGKDAFYKLTNTYVNITNLGTYAEGNNTYHFPNTKHLLVNGTEITELVIPDGVTSIGDHAFSNCSGLTSVTIPDSVTSIRYNAFYNCSSLTSVYCKQTTPPSGGIHMFDNNASSRKIYVPVASVDAYKAAQYWSKYYSYIVGYDF